ncbi:MAG TPA: nicotinate-nucleotide adenylyltransferase [Herpetosiphonaceae bacterium]
MLPRIVILGGTFDPIHIGHLAIAEDVRYTLDASHVLFVPAAQQPLKSYQHRASAAERLAMAQLATADNPAFSVSDIEIRRGGLSYTVETVAEIHAQHPEAQIFFTVGVDAAVTLPKWREVERLLSLCRIVIVERPGYTFDPEVLMAELPAARERILVVPGPALDISASEVRLRLSEGRPIRYHLPAAVREYIEEHGLYQDAPRDDITQSPAYRSQ